MVRYSVEQILAGLRMQFGDIAEDEPLVPQPSTPLGTLLPDDVVEAVDLDSLITGFEEFFGFSISQDEWREFLGHNHDASTWLREYAPKLTFRALAEFIAARSEGISLEPVTVFGRRNSAAGVFLGLQQLAKQIAPQIAEFAPSSRIHDCLQGDVLWRFWHKLLWVSDRRVPDHRYRRLHRLAALGGFILSVSICVFAWQVCVSRGGALIDPVGVFGGIILFCGSCCFFASMMVWLIKMLTSPIPEEINTFRDLAMLLAIKTPDEAHWWREGPRKERMRKHKSSKNPYQSPTVL